MILDNVEMELRMMGKNVMMVTKHRVMAAVLLVRRNDVEIPELMLTNNVMMVIWLMEMAATKTV